MNTSAAVTAYRRHAAGTATNSQLVLMLTARLTSDIAQAMSAINDRQPASAHEFLTHAQDIVNELDDALDTDLCPAGNELAALYAYIRDQLVDANIAKDVGAAENAHRIASQVADMFRAAATERAA